MKTMHYFDKKDEPIDSIIDICNWLNNDPTVETACRKHKRIKVTVEQAESLRSIKSNAFYWAAVIPGFQKYVWTNFSKENVHHQLGELFRSTRKDQYVIDREIAEGRHKTEWYVPSTTHDSAYSFWFFIEQCLAALFAVGGSLEAAAAVEYQDIKGTFKGVSE